MAVTDLNVGKSIVSTTIHFQQTEDNRIFIIPTEEALAAAKSRIADVAKKARVLRNRAERARTDKNEEEARELLTEARNLEAEVDFQTETNEEYAVQMEKLRADVRSQQDVVQLKIPTKARMVEVQINATRQTADGATYVNQLEVASLLLPECVVGKTEDEVQQFPPVLYSELAARLYSIIYPNVDTLDFLSSRR